MEQVEKRVDKSPEYVVICCCSSLTVLSAQLYKLLWTRHIQRVHGADIASCATLWLIVAWFSAERIDIVCTDPAKSWQVMEFKIQISQALKVMELGLGPGKSWKINQILLPHF